MTVVQQATGATEATGSIKSAERVMDLLDLLSQHRDGLTFVAIRTALGLPKSSLHGLLRAMTDRGYLSLDPQARVYRVGIRVWESGHAFQFGHHLSRVALPHLAALRDEVDETVQMAVLDGLENVYLAKQESAQPLRLVSDVGRRLPAHSTALGKMLLAMLPEEEFDRRLDGATLTRFTDQTVADVPALRKEMAEVRLRGYAEDLGEYTAGLYCVAAAVFDARGTAVAAISCSVPVVRLTDGTKKQRQFLEPLQRTAAAISRDLGAR
ncbi:IclR family transcriptional regulator [Dactylosporangium sp. NPDC048998]|uniref:IclR family transcriptional regulator n=1 Tax=Dactylosporangium sp. NPDC048998 TaxID=3363976 RepID=UPI0037160E06